MPEASGVLNDGEVIEELAGRGLNWRLEQGQLAKEVQGRDFASALAYVNAVGELAEEMNHHPDIAISWNRVTLRLVSHSAGGVTEADLTLAERIDALGDPRA